MTSDIETIINKSEQKEISPTKDLSSHNIVKSISKTSESDIQKENSNCILPPLNILFRKKAFLEPTSVLTKFIHENTSSLIRQSNTKLYKPNLKILNLYPSYSNIFNGPKKINYTKDKPISKSPLSQKFSNNKNNLIDNQYEIDNINNNIIININNKINQENKIEEMNNMNIINNKEESFVNEREVKDLVPSKSNTSINKILDPLTINSEPNYSEINLDSSKNNLDYKFRRLCRYFPLKNSKSKKNIKRNIDYSVGSFRKIYFSDIKQQSTIFNEQMNLIQEDIIQYRLCINKDNYFEVFKSMSLKEKITYNKTLEEALGILFSLPKILLGNFYNSIYEIKNVKIPKNENFKETYIYDEVDKVIKNNSLLLEVNDFNKKCFELYIMLSKKVESDKIILCKKDYFQALLYYEKVRKNICYDTNSFYNAEKNYNDDLSVINKIKKYNNRLRLIMDNNDINSSNNNIRNKGEKPKRAKSKILERMIEPLIFKKNKERQRKSRIESAIGIEDKNIKYNYLGKEIKQKKKGFKSIFLSKSNLVNKILYYCDKNTKIQIMTDRIDNQEKRKPFKNKYTPFEINVANWT